MTDVAVDLPTRIMHRTVEEILNPGQRLAANPAKGHRVNIAGISAFLVGSERSSKTTAKAPFSFRSHCRRSLPRRCVSPAMAYTFPLNGRKSDTDGVSGNHPAMTNPHALRTFKHLVWELCGFRGKVMAIPK